MFAAILNRILPASALRTTDELAESLDFSVGDSRAKRSAFWTMLTLSAVIASGGVLTDATATVIGAMIIAPLSTPIMAIALGIVRQRRTGAVATVALGCLLVIAVGVVVSVVIPSSFNLLQNDQIAGRTSPSLVDLVAALATGAAGSVALARRDVGSVMPGVAIAISLVPPLVVAGVCLGKGALLLAAGALVLFLSNLLALMSAGAVVFAASGHGTISWVGESRSVRKERVLFALLFTIVFVVLLGNTAAILAVGVWTGRVEAAAERWVADQPNAAVTDVTMESLTMHVEVHAPHPPPPLQSLVEDVRGQVPGMVVLVVDTTRGQRLHAGAIGS